MDIIDLSKTPFFVRVSELFKKQCKKCKFHKTYDDFRNLGSHIMAVLGRISYTIDKIDLTDKEKLAVIEEIVTKLVRAVKS